jgi:hypothetical protein
MRTPSDLAAVLALALISNGASAQGWFTGGTLGTATQNGYEVGGPITTRDESDGAYRIFGGYLISPIQGVVASYIDLGTAYYEGPAFGGFTDYLSAEGFDISYIIGWTPGSQDRVSLFGTAGVFAWKQDVTYTDIGAPEIYKDSGTSFSVGLGTDINLDSGGSSAWGINIEWQLFKDVGDNDNSGHEYDREVFSVGAHYRFGRN